jgi:hypothetical protein
MAKQGEPPLGVADKLDRERLSELAQSALRKRAAGEKPTQREISALRSHEQERMDLYGPQYVAAVPKGVYSQWSGRQVKTLHEQADRYHIPLRGAKIDVRSVIRWLHDFLVKHKRLLAIPVDIDDPLNDNPEWRDQCYKLRAELMTIEIAVKRGDLAPREFVHDLLARWAVIMSGLGDQLQKLFGPEAARLLNDALDDCAAIADQIPEWERDAGNGTNNGDA